MIKTNKFGSRLKIEALQSCAGLAQALVSISRVAVGLRCHTLSAASCPCDTSMSARMRLAAPVWAEDP